jgi:hypothetical protein
MKNRPLKAIARKAHASQLKPLNWDGHPTTIKIEDWPAFKEVNHLRAVKSEWPEGRQQVVISVSEREKSG